MQGHPEALYGAIEAGGTKFVCALVDGSCNILEEQRFPTADAVASLRAACAFLRDASARLRPLSATAYVTIGAAIHWIKASDEYVVPPALHTQSGVLGAVLLAMDASMRFRAK